MLIFIVNCAVIKEKTMIFRKSISIYYLIQVIPLDFEKAEHIAFNKLLRRCDIPVMKSFFMKEINKVYGEGLNW